MRAYWIMLMYGTMPRALEVSETLPYMVTLSSWIMYSRQKAILFADNMQVKKIHY